MLTIFFLLQTLSWGTQNHTMHPKGAICDIEKSYTYYSICYSNYHRQSLWTFHSITLDSISGDIDRTNDYRADTTLNNPVGSSDYRHTGYDRGHMVPAADMRLNIRSMSESFFMTNMTPQNSSFNSGIWRVLEAELREWVEKMGPAYIVTGVYYDQSDIIELPKKISVPPYLYKAVYFPNKNFMRAFLIPNMRHVKADIQKFSISVNELEHLTDLDLFPHLPDLLEESLEDI